MQNKKNDFHSAINFHFPVTNMHEFWEKLEADDFLLRINGQY